MTVLTVVTIERLSLHHRAGPSESTATASGTGSHHDSSTACQCTCTLPGVTSARTPQALLCFLPALTFNLVRLFPAAFLEHVTITDWIWYYYYQTATRSVTKVTEEVYLVQYNCSANLVLLKYSVAPVISAAVQRAVLVVLQVVLLRKGYQRPRAPPASPCFEMSKLPSQII
eukprot:516772-Rhodomonas_salina.3